MTRDEWRRTVEHIATRRPTVIVCARRAEWDAAMAQLPHESPARQAEARTLIPTMQTGACADCGTAIIWGRSSPLEPVKLCEPCALAWAEARPRGDVWVTPAAFDDEAGRR